MNLRLHCGLGQELEPQTPSGHGGSSRRSNPEREPFLIPVLVLCRCPEPGGSRGQVASSGTECTCLSSRPLRIAPAHRLGNGSIGTSGLSPATCLQFCLSPQCTHCSVLLPFPPLHHMFVLRSGAHRWVGLGCLLPPPWVTWPKFFPF